MHTQTNTPSQNIGLAKLKQLKTLAEGDGRENIDPLDLYNDILSASALPHERDRMFDEARTQAAEHDYRYLGVTGETLKHLQSLACARRAQYLVRHLPEINGKCRFEELPDALALADITPKEAQRQIERFAPTIIAAPQKGWKSWILREPSEPSPQQAYEDYKQAHNAVEYGMLLGIYINTA